MTTLELRDELRKVTKLLYPRKNTLFGCLKSFLKIQLVIIFNNALRSHFPILMNEVETTAVSKPDVALK